jgi:hypothetical protein
VPHYSGEQRDGCGSKDDSEHGLESSWTPGSALALVILALPFVSGRH